VNPAVPRWGRGRGLGDAPPFPKGLTAVLNIPSAERLRRASSPAADLIRLAARSEAKGAARPGDPVRRPPMGVRACEEAPRTG
jgi:hypothetical protein